MEKLEQIAIVGTTKPGDYWSNFMQKLSAGFARRGVVGRTGGAVGVDGACMRGYGLVNPELLKVYVPWKTYVGDEIPEGCEKVVYSRWEHPEWEKSVSIYHPAPKSLGKGAVNLHARNYGLVCDGVPADAVVALPRSLSDWGGTGQAMRIAQKLGIPLYNLRKEEDQKAVVNLLADLDNGKYN